MKNIIGFFFFFLIHIGSALAQRATVSGKILDSSNGEPLVSATITSPTSNGGGYSDIEGKFTASFTTGSHDIKIKLMGYETKIISNVIFTEGEITELGTIKMGVAAQDAIKGGITIRVKKATNSENALIVAQKKSVNLMDGVSAQAFKKSGDGDAASAASRVTGVSVDGGKYLFIRGLGDRYTKTVLNGMEIPGLDPDRNTVQMDIFPTNLIDNIVILKSFTPNLAGDFTGGWVDIQTKDFQSKEAMSISLSLGFNPAMNLNSNYLSHESTNADLLAFGKSSRNLPFSEPKVIPKSEYTQSGGGAQRAESNANAFSKNMDVMTQTNMLNTSFSLDYGNQYNKNNKTYGFNVVTGYSNTFNYYDNVIFQTYLRNEDKSVNELTLAEKNNGSVGENEVLWSTLTNGSIKAGKHSFSTSIFHTRNGVKKSSKLFYENVANPFGDAGATLDRTILYYNQRTLTNLFFKHEFEKDSAWKFITKLSPSISTNNEPDMKITALSVGEDGYKFNVGAGSEIKRLYRNLSEKNINSKFDAERKIFIGNSKVSKLKFGMAHNYKHRDFAVLQYVFQPIGSFNLNGDPNQIFDEYLYNAESDRGYAVFGEPIKSNEFVSSMNVMGLYAMNELPIGARTTAIYGFRVEKSDMFYTGENTNNESYLNYKVLDEMNILPSASFIYRATSGINVRIAASQTIARPSFKEKSLAQIYDPISGRTFIGNLDLEQTEITNLDLRFEKFMKRGELISVSGFYKHFNNPIEIVVYKPETPTNFTPRNAVSADIYGAELEIRKSLSFLSDKLSLASNFSYILSQVEMTPNERIGKTNELRKGQTLDDKREMQGQAPYIINFGINYDNRESGFTANLSYNVQGPKLSIVGIGRLPDVYTESFHSLNFKSSYSLGKGKRSQISFAVTNLLNDIPVQVYRGLNAEDKIFTQRLVQRTFKIGYSLKIK
jgi:hypothetical protein